MNKLYFLLIANGIVCTSLKSSSDLSNSKTKHSKTYNRYTLGNGTHPYILDQRKFKRISNTRYLRKKDDLNTTELTYILNAGGDSLLLSDSENSAPNTPCSGSTTPLLTPKNTTSPLISFSPLHISDPNSELSNLPTVFTFDTFDPISHISKALSTPVNTPKKQSIPNPEVLILDLPGTIAEPLSTGNPTSTRTSPVKFLDQQVFSLLTSPTTPYSNSFSSDNTPSSPDDLTGTIPTKSELGLYCLVSKTKSENSIERLNFSE